MGLSDAVNEWKDLISNIPLQYYAVFFKNYKILFTLYVPAPPQNGLGKILKQWFQFTGWRCFVL
jgi:predicted 3-demethylubiquinone-9 3-methyltransferase (glyoxalase superfamily)